MSDIYELLKQDYIPKKKEFVPSISEQKPKIQSLTFAETQLLENSISAWAILEASINTPNMLNKFKKPMLEKDWKIQENQFVADFWKNLSMEVNIWLADMMDETVERIKVSWVRNGKSYSYEWVRDWLKGSFYTATPERRYIPVFSWSVVEILKPLRDENKLKEIKDSNSKIETNIKTSWNLDEFRKKHSQKEFDLILKKSLEYNIDPYFLFALRTAENGWEWKEFGITDWDIETFWSQLIHMCRNIQNNIQRFQKFSNKKVFEDGTKIFSLEFISFLSYTYNKTNFKELVKTYWDYSWHKFWEIDEKLLKEWQKRDVSKDLIWKTTEDALISEMYKYYWTQYKKWWWHGNNGEDGIDCSWLLTLGLKNNFVYDQWYNNTAAWYFAISKPKEALDVKRWDLVFLKDSSWITHVEIAIWPIETINWVPKIPILDSCTNKDENWKMKWVSQRYQSLKAWVLVWTPPFYT